MSTKCRAYSKITNGTEPEGYKKGFYDGWDICKQLVDKDKGSAISSGANFRKGVWFRSAVFGMMYENHASAGDIDCVYVDGVPFDRCDSYPK